MGGDRGRGYFISVHKWFTLMDRSVRRGWVKRVERPKKQRKRVEGEKNDDDV